MRRKLLAIAAVGAMALAVAAPASAASPLRLGPFTDTYSGYLGSCDGFDINVDGHESYTVDVYFDESGQLVRVVRHDSAPHDVLTNSVTGTTIVVRAEFDETMVPIPGTDEATKTIVGFRYMVNEPGAGVTVRDVGRIVYGDFEQTILLWEAGKHDATSDAALGASLCGALG
jgi:hypothetical protein